MPSRSRHQREMCLLRPICQYLFFRACLEFVGPGNELAEQRGYETTFCGNFTEDLGLLMDHHPVEERTESFVVAGDFDGDEHAAAEEGGRGGEALDAIAREDT